MVVAVATMALSNLTSNPQSSSPTASKRSPIAPVLVRSCSVGISRAGTIVWVDFVNESHLAALEVRIAVRVASGSTIELVDRGTFSPNVDIRHALRPPSGSETVPGSTVSCSASYARFENGTDWIPSAAAAVRKDSPSGGWRFYAVEPYHMRA